MSSQLIETKSEYKHGLRAPDAPYALRQRDHRDDALSEASVHWAFGVGRLALGVSLLCSPQPIPSRTWDISPDDPAPLPDA